MAAAKSAPPQTPAPRLSSAASRESKTVRWALKAAAAPPAAGAPFTSAVGASGCTRAYRGSHTKAAEALDLLGERWTLLILLELLGGARRYTDLRQALPGIATNLLASRLRQLVTRGEQLSARLDFAQVEVKAIFDFAHDRLYGFDDSEQMAAVARINMLVNEDGRAHIFKHNSLLSKTTPSL